MPLPNGTVGLSKVYKKYKQVDSGLWCICICSVTDHGDGSRMWEEQKSDKQAITKCVIDALATFWCHLWS